MNKKNISILVIILVLIIGVSIYISTKNHNTVSSITDTNPTEKIHSQVTAFGTTLKEVSLLAPSDGLKESMEEKYGPYLTSNLLAEWENNPAEALGRNVSSPWPDRIEISSITKQDENTYLVSGNVIEVTSAETDGTPFDLYPVNLTLIKENGEWLINQVTKEEYQKVSQDVNPS